MTNDMGIVPDDLSEFAGSPFTQAQIDAAVFTVQAAAFWHISPEQQDTVNLDILPWSRMLVLPTRHLISVEEIRDLDLDTVIDEDLYRVSIKLGQVNRKGYAFWPAGYQRISVQFTHGYEDVPPDLLTVIAEACLRTKRDQTAKQFGAGPMTVAYDLSLGTSDTNPLSSSSVFDRYRLWQPGIA